MAVWLWEELRRDLRRSLGRQSKSLSMVEGPRQGQERRTRSGDLRSLDAVRHAGGDRGQDRDTGGDRQTALVRWRRQFGSKSSAKPNEPNSVVIFGRGVAATAL